MSFNKLTISREFGLGAGMTIFMCLAPQNSEFWTGALFVGMFTIYEVFPDFHWVPAWTAYKMLSKEEDLIQGVLRLAAQFVSAIIGGIIGYQLLDSGDAAYPKFAGDDWRNFIWLVLVWGAWLGLTNHENGKGMDGFRRNFALTATFVSVNYLLQAVGMDLMLNSAVNFGRTVGAKIYLDDQENAMKVDMDKIWLILITPFVGALLAWVALYLDSAIASWAAPAAGNEETTAVYGSTGNINKGDEQNDDKKGDDNA